MWMFVFLLVLTPAFAMEWDNIKNYDEDTNSITIKNAFGLPLIGNDLAKYTLTKNTDHCLIDCSAEGIVEIFNEDKLFSKMEFEKSNGEINNLNYRLFINHTDSYEVEVIENKEVCETIIDKNNTINECEHIFVGSHKETRYNSYWKPYEGEVLNTGVYQWRIEGKKNPSDKIDWIGTAQGKRLSEWAWWDGDWQYKRNITITNNDGSNAVNETYTVNLTIDTTGVKFQDDCDDIRIVLADIQEIDSEVLYCNTANTRVRWNMNSSLAAGGTNTSFKIYYGNSDATAGLQNYSLVYNLWDDFEDGVINQDLWDNCSLQTTPPQIINGKLNVYVESNGGDDYSLVMSNQEFYSHHIEFVNVNQTITAAQIYMGFDNDASCGDGTLEPPERFAYAGGDSGHIIQRVTGTVLNDTVKANYGLNDNWSMVQWGNNWSARNSWDIHKEGNSKVDGMSPFKLKIMGDESDSSFYGSVDEIKVRQYMYPEPTLTMDAEEETKITTATLITPINNTNSSSSSIDLTCNATTSGGVTLDNISLYVWRYGTEYDVQHNTSLAGGTSEQPTFTVSLTEEGTYNWNCRSSGDNGDYIDWTSNNWTFLRDVTPPDVNVTLSQYKYLIIDESLVNVTINFTSNDSIVGLDTCWYYNGTANVTYTCGQNVTNNYTAGTHTIYVYANDTLGNENQSLTTLTVFPLTTTVSYDTPVLEGENVSISLELNFSSISTLNANITYNGTNYTIDVVNNGTYARLNRTVIAPQVGGKDNVTFRFNYVFDGFDLNTSWYNQTILNFGMDDCSSNPTKILNITAFKEKHRELLNGSIEVDVYVYSLSNYNSNWTYSGSDNETTNYSVCIADGILNESDYGWEYTIKFNAPKYITELWHFQNETLDNDTIPEYINLYGLASSDSTSFLVEVRDKGFSAVNGAVVEVWRKYNDDGQWRIVERPLTDINGETVAHFEEEDAEYTFKIKKGGTTLFSTPVYVITCQTTPCELTLLEESEVTNIDDLDEWENGGYVLSVNNDTRTVSVAYTMARGTSTVNLTVYEYVNNGTLGVVSAQESGLGGTINVVIPKSGENKTYFAVLLQDGNFIKSIWVDLRQHPSDIFDPDVALWGTILIVMALVLMSLSTGVGVIIFAGVGLLIASVLMLLDLSSAGVQLLVYILSAGAIIVWKITRGEK